MKHRERMAWSKLRAGSVLIVTLWASIGLVSVALLFGHAMVMAYRGADNDLAGRQADAAIEGAMRYVETLLLNAETPGLFPDATTYPGEAVAVGESEFWFLGKPADQGTNTTPEYALVDEASKLNLNTATIDMLRLLPGMSEELAAAIIDWRDADDEVTDNGAESGTYLALQPGHNCKNAPFESIEELGWVNGATRTILYGKDTNLNGILDPSESSANSTLTAGVGLGNVDFGILEYVTVFSRERNKQTDGTTDRVNIANFAAGAESLRTLLNAKLGTGSAEKILPLIGPQPPLRSVLEFYIRAKSQLSEDDFAKTAPELTVVDAATNPYVSGLINVNTASETVLACIPGIGTEKAASVITARQARSQQDTSFAWIAEVLGDESAIQAGPFITGQSWQVSADVAAVGRHGRGYRRTRFVIDQSSGTPKIIYRRNLSSLGWALGAEVRQQLASGEVR